MQLLLVVCLIGAALAAPTQKQKRDILPGDPRYGTDAAHHHHHHHHQEHANEIEVARSIGGYAGSYVVPESNNLDNSYLTPSIQYGPPGLEPGKPIGISDFVAPSVEANNAPSSPTDSYGQPIADVKHPVEVKLESAGQILEAPSASYIPAQVGVSSYPNLNTNGFGPSGGSFNFGSSGVDFGSLVNAPYQVAFPVQSLQIPSFPSAPSPGGSFPSPSFPSLPSGSYIPQSVSQQVESAFPVQSVQQQVVHVPQLPSFPVQSPQIPSFPSAPVISSDAVSVESLASSLGGSFPSPSFSTLPSGSYIPQSVSQQVETAFPVQSVQQQVVHVPQQPLISVQSPPVPSHPSGPVLGSNSESVSVESVESFQPSSSSSSSSSSASSSSSFPPNSYIPPVQSEHVEVQVPNQQISSSADSVSVESVSSGPSLVDSSSPAPQVEINVNHEQHPAQEQVSLPVQTSVHQEEVHIPEVQHLNSFPSGSVSDFESVSIASASSSSPSDSHVQPVDANGGYIY